MTRTDWETEHPRKSVNLLPEQWERLDAIAAELASPATRGAAMEPSWRTLLRDIADGKLAVMPGDVATGNAWLKCTDPNCDSRPFQVERIDLVKAGGWIGCEHCGKPCIEVEVP